MPLLRGHLQGRPRREHRRPRRVPRFLADSSQAADTHDERLLDARRQVGLLLASAGHHEEALTFLQDLRHDLIAAHGDSSAEVAEVAALVTRIERYDSSVS